MTSTKWRFPFLARVPAVPRFRSVPERNGTEAIWKWQKRDGTAVAWFLSSVVFSDCNFGSYFQFRQCVFGAFFHFLPFSYFTRLGFIQNGTERRRFENGWNGTERNLGVFDFPWISLKSRGISAPTGGEGAGIPLIPRARNCCSPYGVIDQAWSSTHSHCFRNASCAELLITGTEVRISQ